MRSILGILIVFLSFQGLWAHEGEGRAYVFLPNKGQFDPGVRYKAKINGGALFLEDKAWTFHFHDNSVIQKAHLGQEVPEKDNALSARHRQESGKDRCRESRSR